MTSEAARSVSTEDAYAGPAQLHTPSPLKRARRNKGSLEGDEAPILQKWQILRPKILSLLGTEPWLALELLRRGQDLTGNNNPITVVIMIEEHSDSDWSLIRYRIVKLLEDSDCAYLAVEIGRGIVTTDAKKDPRNLPEQAYDLPALPGTIIAPRGSSISAGTFGCSLKVRQSSNHKWETKGITCHHVILPDYLQYSSKPE